MLNIFQSNRVEILADALAEAMRTSSAGALQTETVVVQSSAMSRWLSFALAERLGVTANVRFAFPASYIWSLFGVVLPQVSAQSPFEPEVLSWTFMGLLESDARLRKQARLAHYLSTGDARQRHELARRLAEVYDRYLVYRPDWIAAWSEGKTVGLGTDEGWQAMLWRAAAAGAGDHMHAHPRESFYAAIARDAEARARLPQSLHLFAMDALPPMYLEVFEHLAAHVDVTLYALNPCREYWGDIVKRRALARQAATDTPADTYLEVGNSLLASMGVHGRAFFDALAELRSREAAHYVEPAGDTLLATLQRDVLDLRERGDGGAPCATVTASDESLQVHVCHGPLREVEVLHDRLLDAFERDRGLRPGDVLVLVPQLDVYAPAIEAVFATAPERLRIPYSIADHGMTRESAVLRAFSALLDFPHTRFEAEAVLALLEHPPIARRFDIDADELAQAREWLRETGVRWGYDESARSALELPPTREHSWRAGLDRLLLGYALPGEGMHFYGDTLPYDDVEGSAAALVGRLQSLVDALKQLDEESRRARSMNDWRRYADRIIGAMFDLDETGESEAQRIRSAAQALCDHTEHAAYRGVVPHEVWRAELARQLEPDGGAYGFLAGGVTFAALAPMRPVPARFIALLGMNDGAFPSAPRSMGFDLMEDFPRRGDRVRRDEDRQAFLDALLSARERLYLSYTGRSVRDNAPLPPSPLVSELLETVRRGYVDEQGGNVLPHLIVEHPLQPFSPRYFDGRDQRLFSYQDAYAVASRAIGTEQDVRAFLAAPLPLPDQPGADLTLESLQRFLSNPARHFLRERLGIVLPRENEAVPDTEPFELDGRSIAWLGRVTLARRIGGMERDEALRLARAEGLLPHGAVGAVAYGALADKLELLAVAIRSRGALRSENIAIDLGGVTLTGAIDGIAHDERIEWQGGDLRVWHRLNAWVRHLAYNAAIAPGATILHALDKQVRYAPVENALEQLQTLAALMREGLRAPLPFFPRSSCAYAETLRKGRVDPMSAARRKWESNGYAAGEADDPWFSLAFRGVDNPLDERFAEIARLVYEPLLEAERDDG